jgi:NarL family two-component system response regulator LiaR
MREPIRVLVADDHAVVRQGLRLFLDLQPDLDVVGEASDGAQAVERARELQPDLVLMDLSMPGTDGVQATRALRATSPATKVLVLTSFADDEHVVSALQAGAVGYLMKDAPPDEVAEAVRTISRGDPLVHPEALRALVRGLADANRAPEGTVTLVFTDVEGSAGLFDRLGDERARAILRQHDRMLRDAIERHSGTEVKHQGDGLMAAFSSARRALRCAVEIQQALAERARTHPDTPLRVRIGINTCEAIAEDDDYFGAGVVVAARIARAAKGGEILLSEVTRALVGGSRISMRDRGEQRLKGLDGTYRLYEAQWTESASS